MSTESTKSFSFQLTYALDDLIGSFSLLVKGEPSYKTRFKTLAIVLVAIWITLLPPIAIWGGARLLSVFSPDFANDLAKLSPSFWQSSWHYTLFVILAPIVLYILYFVVKQNVIGKSVIRLVYKLKKPEYSKSYEFTFDDTGCTVQQESATVKYEWQYFQYVLAGKNHLIFKRNNKKVFSIPKRVFSNEVESEKFLEFLKQYVNLVYSQE
jgi:hypothetical protein